MIRSLYLTKIQTDEWEKSYKDVALEFQRKSVGDFYEGLAHCTLIEVTKKEPSCAMERRIKSSQVKRRPKNS